MTSGPWQPSTWRGNTSGSPPNPRPRETRLSDQEAALKSLASLCHVLFNLNEFIYVD